MTKAKSKKAKMRKAVIIAGIRTPFVRAFSEFLKMDTIALGVEAAGALLSKTELPRKEIDGVMWGGVIFPGLAPNVGREIVLDLGLPVSATGMTCSMACTSGLRAITLAASAIERGEADVMIAGGSDSTSNTEINLPQKVVHAMAPLAFGKATPADMLGVLSQLMPITEILPKMPKIAERTTGEVMGEAAEKMGRRHEITREEQDAFAVASHHRAAEAIASGRLQEEIATVQTPEGKKVFADTMVRGDTSVEKLAKLRPVFARKGTLTAGNSCPLTDGASAVLLMTEDKAKALGYKPLARFVDWTFAGVDPADRLLMGPAIAMPQVLDKAGLTLQQMDFVDIHEAFAAQVLAITKMMASDAFARTYLGQDKAAGEVDPAKLNVHGGSISLGHPFGATGARMTTTMAYELQKTGKQYALLGICAAGGLAVGAILENADS